MCDVVYRVQNCSDEQDVRYIQNVYWNDASLNVDSKYTFNSGDATFCGKILGVGTDAPACVGFGGLNELYPSGELNWTVSGTCTDSCFDTAECKYILVIKDCITGKITNVGVDSLNNNTPFTPVSTHIVGQYVNVTDSVTGNSINCGYVLDVGVDLTAEPTCPKTDIYGNVLSNLTSTLGYENVSLELCNSIGQHFESWNTYEFNAESQTIETLSTDETFVDAFPASKFGDCEDIFGYIRSIRDNILLNGYYVQNINPIADGINSIVQFKENCNNKSITFVTGDYFIQFVENNDGTLSIYQYDQTGFGNLLKYNCCDADLMNELTNNESYSYPNELSGIGTGLFDW